MSTTTENRQIAQTIINQISAVNYWALGAWGCSQLVALDETDTRIGGLQFGVKCPKLKKGIIRIELNGLDLYNVRVYRKTRKKVGGIFVPHMPVFQQVKDVYAEDLVGIIDGIVG